MTKENRGLASADEKTSKPLLGLPLMFRSLYFLGNIVDHF
jgi:hypothetical protein